MLKFFKRKPKETKENSKSADTNPKEENNLPHTDEQPNQTEELTNTLLPDENSVALNTPNQNNNNREIEPNNTKAPSLFNRLKDSLSKTRTKLTDGITNLFLGKKTIDEDLLDELESRLIMADVGIEATESILNTITEGISRKTIKDPQAVLITLMNELENILVPCEQPLNIPKNVTGPFVILMIGVNGSGKTTTIGKLSKHFLSEGKSVMLAAGDTFRAAAVEQLQVWGQRNNVPVIAQHTGADSASVLYDALNAAKARNIDILIADTAGRLHTQSNLMEELKKVVRVLKKLDENAPHEVLLVLDAGTGQNALIQADKFNAAMNITGLCLTKLDGTAKGGIIFAIAKKLGLPIRYIGVGEQAEDLRAFKAKEFVKALFENIHH